MKFLSPLHYESGKAERHAKRVKDSWKAMLLDAGSYAFGLLEHCFRTARAMLSDC